MITELHNRRENIEYEHGNSFRLFVNNEVENYPPHWHTDLEIIMPLENNYTVILDKTTYTLNPEDIIIIPSGQLHELHAPNSGRRLIFQVDHAIIREVNGFDSVYNKFFPCALLRKTDSINEHHELVRILLQIADEYTKASPLYEACIHSLTIYFFVIVGRIPFRNTDTFTGIGTHKQQSYIEVFFNLCTYLNEHCTENITLEQLAGMSGFSKSHFIRLFKDYTGVSYYEYLTKRRMINAEILLLGNPELSITDLALKSGFNSLATFNRVFKNAHDCTPTEYRKKFKVLNP